MEPLPALLIKRPRLVRLSYSIRVPLSRAALGIFFLVALLNLNLNFVCLCDSLRMCLFLFAFFSLLFADGYLDVSKSDLHLQFLVVIVTSLVFFKQNCIFLFSFFHCTIVFFSQSHGA